MFMNYHMYDRNYVTSSQDDLWLFYLNLSSGEFNSTSSHVWQLVFAYVSIQGWVIDSDENIFFN